MKNIEQMKVGEIVAHNFRTSKVFTAHGIDFCCGGGISLTSACQKKNLDMTSLIREINAATTTPDRYGYESMGLKELIDTIVNVHHHYISTTIPAMETYLGKLCMVHGERHPELYEIKDLFFEGAQALTDHMHKEELILFPYIKAMVEADEKGFPLSSPHFGSIENPIHMMEAEHESEGARFQKIQELSQNYTSPPDGCQTYIVTYSLLKEFQEDLHKHIHLENNILFPKASKMFAELQLN